MKKKNPYIFYFIDKYNIDELTNLEKNIDLIFRNYNKKLKINEIKSIQNFCKIDNRNLYLSNNIKLALKLGLSGVYIPSFNNSLNFASKHSLPNKFEIIGSAHNHKEIYMKIKQGRDSIIFSKLFSVNYDPKASFLGVIKFNNFLKTNKNLVPLGGINLNNLNNLNQIKCNGFALMSEIKKKPAKIFSRLF